MVLPLPLLEPRIRHRRFQNATRQAGLAAEVSARALIT